MSGLAIEAATERVEIAAYGDGEAPLAHRVETVGHGHTRRLTPLVREVLDRAGLDAAALEWVAADLGPGSFTGVRVGLATAEALALAGRSRLRGASSLAALAHSVETRKSLIVPLVPAGRRDLYAGYYRADSHGHVLLMGAPEVGPPETLMARVAEARAALGRVAVRCVGPGATRIAEQLEQAFPGSTRPPWRAEGLSALDLAAAARSGGGPAAGLPADGEVPQPLYVRPAQAEDRVRKRVHAARPTTLRPLTADDIPAIAEIERRVFTDPWPASFFAGELGSPLVYAMVAERDGELAGYSVAWLGRGVGHLGNIAVVPGMRRRGVAQTLLDDLLARARALEVGHVALEVRVSNFPAQWLYRANGFRMAGVRPRYYRDTNEDALVMEWHEPCVSA